MMKFSVCMSIRTTPPLFWGQAIDSVAKQLVQLDEVVLVVEGAISDALQQMVLGKQNEYPNIHPIFLSENKGLGNALKDGKSWWFVGICGR